MQIVVSAALFQDQPIALLLKHLKMNQRLLEVPDFLADSIIPVRGGLSSLCWGGGALSRSVEFNLFLIMI